jgi:hypothetical protein
MAYDAITIDTQTVYGNNRSLDRGIVAQLSQYKDGIVRVVLSEVVVRELFKMLETKAKTTVDALNKAIREGRTNGQLTPNQEAALQGVVDAIAAPDKHAEAQLKAFVEATGAEIISVGKVAIKDLLHGYFGKKPPFSTQGKKDEFPDAISLLALEAWAKEHDRKILAVSKDCDWKAFSEHCERIDCVDDLGMAMATLVAARQASEEDAWRVLQAVEVDDPPELRAELTGQLQSAVEVLTPYAEFDGPMPGEDEGVMMSLLDFNITGVADRSASLDIVRVRPAGFVMRVPVEIKARAFADIHFSIYDSIDKDHVPMGSTDVECDVEFEASALIDCEKHEIDLGEGKKEASYKIVSAELIDAPHSVDLGYIDYSLAGEDDDFDPDDLKA